jgi:hypothetical protein
MQIKPDPQQKIPRAYNLRIYASELRGRGASGVGAGFETDEVELVEATPALGLCATEG